MRFQYTDENCLKFSVAIICVYTDIFLVQNDRWIRRCWITLLMPIETDYIYLRFVLGEYLWLYHHAGAKTVAVREHFIFSLILRESRFVFASFFGPKQHLVNKTLNHSVDGRSSRIKHSEFSLLILNFWPKWTSYLPTGASILTNTFFCHLRSIAAHRDQFVRRLSAFVSVCVSVR